MHDDNEVSQFQNILFPSAEVADQAIVFINCEKLRNCFFNFRIWEFEGNVFRHMPVECQKVIKLSERP